MTLRASESALSIGLVGDHERQVAAQKILGRGKNLMRSFLLELTVRFGN